MLKRIPSDQLRLGMHLHELCGSWMDHPFWRAKFTLSDPKDLRRIRESGIAEVWIDTTKGLDVQGGVPQSVATEQAEHDLVVAVSTPTPEPRTSLGEELQRAAAVMRQSRSQVVSLFNNARLGHAIDAAGCLPVVDEISASVLRNPNALVSLVRLKSQDDYTYMHSVAVCALMVALARQLQLPDDQVREAGLAGMLHDLGKAQVPLDVLNKPGRLTDAEFGVMRSHPLRGWEMLKDGGAVGEIPLDVCLHHHEKLDGSGYPHHLAGDMISIHARMGAVCDVYDAVTSDRPYKRGWDPGDAVRQMVQWKGHFDPLVFQAFVKSVGIYPLGTLVRLESGRLAVVSEPHPQSLLAPKVKVFFSLKSNMGIPPQEIDLARPGCADRIVGVESPEKWNFRDLTALWAPQGASLLD